MPSQQVRKTDRKWTEAIVSGAVFIVIATEASALIDRLLGERFTETSAPPSCPRCSSSSRYYSRTNGLSEAYPQHAGALVT
jgi:hypothetical protein